MAALGTPVMVSCQPVHSRIPPHSISVGKPLVSIPANSSSGQNAYHFDTFYQLSGGLRCGTQGTGSRCFHPISWGFLQTVFPMLSFLVPPKSFLSLMSLTWLSYVSLFPWSHVFFDHVSISTVFFFWWWRYGVLNSGPFAC
jgi:hypothetical protein